MLRTSAVCSHKLYHLISTIMQTIPVGCAFSVSKNVNWTEHAELVFKNLQKVYKQIMPTNPPPQIHHWCAVRLTDSALVWCV